MEVKEIVYLGLLYFAGLAYVFTIGLNGYIENKRMKQSYAIHLDNMRNIENQFSELMELQTKSLIALASQKSMILVRDPETGSYVLKALDTASKEYVRQFIENQYKAFNEQKDNKENDK